MKIDLILRLTTLVLLIIWRVYWFLTAKNALAKKPKTKTNVGYFEKILIGVTGGYLFINLIGFVIFPFNNIFIQFVGLVFVILGFTECIVARKNLDTNWTESYEYQIKKDHELITKGIYGYVRHPIYGGILMMFPGSLIVAGSYSFLVVLIIILIGIEIFARREEKLLTKHFGKKYIEYMKATKKFIPFVY
ncbi:MAG: isoprenylcysteine carboxylmethyltransferase family protein [Patescibacteria group bacterium]